MDLQSCFFTQETFKENSLCVNISVAESFLMSSNNLITLILHTRKQGQGPSGETRVPELEGVSFLCWFHEGFDE